MLSSELLAVEDYVDIPSTDSDFECVVFVVSLGHYCVHLSEKDNTASSIAQLETLFENLHLIAKPKRDCR